MTLRAPTIALAACASSTSWVRRDRLLHGAIFRGASQGTDDGGAKNMPKHRIFTMEFSKVYLLYVKKAERKNRTQAEVDQIICWLTGYSQAGLEKQIAAQSDFETFFAQAPAFHPDSALIKGLVCGVRVENVEDPLMKKIRYLDKLIDELAKGKTMEKILR